MLAGAAFYIYQSCTRAEKRIQNNLKSIAQLRADLANSIQLLNEEKLKAEIQNELLAGRFNNAIQMMDSASVDTAYKKNWTAFIASQQQLMRRNYDSLFSSTGTLIAGNAAEIARLRNEIEEIDKSKNADDSTRMALLVRLDSMVQANIALKSKVEKSAVFLKIKSNKGGKLYYVGEVDNGNPHGKGVGIYESLSVYEGEWQHGMRHGTGKHNWKDGESYDGEFREDKRNGYGTYTFQTGDVWAGYWKDDARNGEGVLYDSKGQIKLSGVWKNDRHIRDGNKMDTGMYEAPRTNGNAQ